MEPTPKLYQLSLRTILEVMAVIAVILAFWFQWVGPARYQLSPVALTSGGIRVYMHDTRTGQVWWYDNNRWIPYEPLPISRR
jgi:hypothetical protein